MKKAVSDPRVTVKVDRELYDQLKAYSDVTGVTMTHILHEALSDFVATSMKARMDSLMTKPSNVIAIDSMALAATAATA